MHLQFLQGIIGYDDEDEEEEEDDGEEGAPRPPAPSLSGPAATVAALALLSVVPLPRRRGGGGGRGGRGGRRGGRVSARSTRQRGEPLSGRAMAPGLGSTQSWTCRPPCVWMPPPHSGRHLVTVSNIEGVKILCLKRMQADPRVRARLVLGEEPTYCQPVGVRGRSTRRWKALSGGSCASSKPTCASKSKTPSHRDEVQQVG